MITNQSVDGKTIYKCRIFRLAMFDYRRVKWRDTEISVSIHLPEMMPRACRTTHPTFRRRSAPIAGTATSIGKECVFPWLCTDGPWKKWIWRKATNVGTMMWLENTGIIWDEQNSTWGYMMGPSRYQDQTGIEIVIYYNDLLWTFIPFQHLVA
jgi:hypothetical protein